MNIERKTGKRAGGESTPGRGRGTGLVENRISSRFLAPVLCMIAAVGILLAIFTTGAEAADGNFGGGTGTVQNPYLIEDALDLQAMRNNLTAHYALANDIDASATKDWNNGSGFEPVGKDSKNRFTGSLDGRNYTITGLYIDRSDTSYVGLLGYIGTGGTVTNVGLVDADVTGGSSVGGLVGRNDAGSVSNCYATGNVRAGEGYYVGGLAGRNGGSVSNSYATGNVSGNQYVGGVVGWNSGSVVNCYATGNVNASGTVGGLVGVNSGSVENSSATGNVTGSRSVGGLVGLNEGSGASVSNSYATGNVSGNRDVGGLVGGNLYGSVVSNSHYNIDSVLINGGNYVTFGGLFQDQYQDWFDNGMGLKISDYSATLVPSGDFHEISTVHGLRDLLGFADFAGYAFRLVSDIDLSTAPNLYVPYLVAEFDGNNHTIFNILINQNFTTYVGMFGTIDSGSVRNLGLVDVDITGYGYVGGLAGYIVWGTSEENPVSNCYVTGKVSGMEWYIGGLVGSNNKGSISNCYAVVNVTGRYSVGGLLGYTVGLVSNCYATGSVSGNQQVGGLVGYNRDGSVSNCYATGSVSGTEAVGGLVGYNWGISGSVENCYASGSVSGNRQIGGLVGENRASVTNSFYNSETTGQSDTGKGTPKSTMEMKTRTTFTGADWDFDDVWCMIENITYPLLIVLELPTARASPDQAVDQNTLVTFDGSASTDNYGIINYTWTFKDGTGNITLYGIAPNHTFMVEGLYIVTLNVTNSLGFWDTDTLTVIVDSTPPSADAGPHQTVDEGTPVNFDGSASSDNVGIVSYIWTFHDGTGDSTLYGVTPVHTFTVPGTYTVTLTVTDATGYQATDDLTVTVKDITPPSAHAGPDQTVAEGAQVTFDGSASTDNVGIVNYTWTFHDGSEDITLYGVGPIHTFTIPGIYIVMLTVTDAVGQWGTDTLTAIVDSTPPIANTGPDLIVDEGAQVTFDGSASTDNVGIVNFTWTFPDGADNTTLYGIAPTHIFTMAGIYDVMLNVTDAAGYWNTDTLTVIVDSTPPSAHAGPDRIVDKGAQVTFDGSASTDNVGIANYTWTFHDGTEDKILYGVAPNHAFPVEGVYSVTLTVTDAAGNRDTDTLTVIVDSTPPSAHAGPDRRVDEGGLATFDASASTDNMGIVNYTWTFHDGTGNVTLYGVAPNHTFAVPGIYVITLTVTDVAGNRGTDTMTVVVDSTPPSAHAGPDRIVDESEQMTFDGSASTDNVGIVNYTWTFNDGTGDVILYGVGPDHPFPFPGVYTVTLLVSDIAGLNDTDTMTVTVLDITPPTAHAGPDRTVDEGTTMTFNGSASTDNVGIVNYTWTFSYHGTEITLHGVSPVFRFWTQGTYHVTLVVRDAAGNDASDALVVHVSSGDTLPGDDDDGDDDDPSPFDFLFRKYGPLPLAGYAIIVGCLILLAFAGTGGSRGRSGQNNGEPGGSTAVSMPPVSPVLPVPSVQPVPPDQSVPPSPPSGFAPPSEEAPSPGTWYCPRCGQQLDGGYVFCLRCGQRKRG